MKEKPDGKAIVIINLVNNIPMAVVMSVTAPILMGIPLAFGSVMSNILIAFVLACVINVVLPIPVVAAGFAALLKQKPESGLGRFIGNFPVCLIFVLIIGLILNLYNVRQVPDFLFAFLGTFPPLYGVCFLVSLVTNPIAMKLAFNGKTE